MTIIQETSAENLQQISGLPSLREESGARFQLENENNLILGSLILTVLAIDSNPQ